ncbi:putative uncharacterized protein [Tetragenococcus halophilus subsp. halophilus]|uniref:DUF1659 domain-containing protein n=3 Tax=Tetragenococcus halophilus TaxID=51669 RepID=A0A2H6D2W6_TETHA|nr:putative uncharacterized protein [Tetragenococcus halophilus subsp. halophilus]GBD71585.1 putative uncharacterized protein [Tetragenococcus halophilus subsp. halophilus]
MKNKIQRRMTMKNLEKTKLTVELSQPGEDKTLKKNFNDVVSEPSESAVLALGETMANLAPEENELALVTETVEYSHVQDAEEITE